jgi:hypothetical protein
MDNGKVIYFRKGILRDRKLSVYLLFFVLILSSSLLFTAKGKYLSKYMTMSNINDSTTDSHVIFYMNEDHTKKSSFSVFKEMVGQESPIWIGQGPLASYDDTSMLNYLGLDYVKEQVSGIDTPTVIIFDQLVDYKHPELQNVVDQVVTINNNGVITEYSKAEFSTIDPHNVLSDLYPYLHQMDNFGHGTHVAGIIHQIAPNAKIISVAHTFSYASFLPIVDAFLNWLDNQKESGGLRIVNISEGWTKALESNERSLVAEKFRQIVTYTGQRFLFVIAAGNEEEGIGGEDNNWNIVFPADLADDWDSEYNLFRDYQIENKVDIDGEPIFANGIISVSSIYDEGSDVGLRDIGFVFDNDGNGDLQIMAPGFEILSTFPISNPGDPNKNYSAIYSGTSMAAPVIAGTAALFAEYTLSTSALFVEKRLLETAIYDANIDYEGTIETERIELQKRYGLGAINPLKLFGFEDIDRDSDGLMDRIELYTYHTNPLETDSDYDGLSDKEEVLLWQDGYITNPNDPDSDNDGLLDGEEFTYNTDPNDEDTDDDWLLDGDEINIHNTSPSDGDTDNDTLLDGWEVASGYSPNNQDTDSDGINDPDDDNDGDGLIAFSEMFYGTLDNNNDTDGDLINDYDEIHFTMTDPLDEDTNHNGVSDSEEDPDNDGLTNLLECQADTNPYLYDTDGDGLSDGWEIANNLDPLVHDSANDPDNDNSTNLEEYSNGTDPHDSDTDDDGMPDGWEITYSLNPLSDDSTADADGDNLDNIDEYTIGSDPTDTDTDNDGLNDKLEFLNGCDPNDTDTDNDGWGDYFEVYTSGTEPDDSDTDNDGITDKTEYDWWRNTYGQSSSSAYSKIKDYDSDNDQLSDGWEKSHGVNPLDNDCDNDGLLDGLEVNTYQTDPEDPDSDNDGYDDLTEVINGTDPNDPNDHPGGGGWGW